MGRIKHRIYHDNYVYRFLHGGIYTLYNIICVICSRSTWRINIITTARVITAVYYTSYTRLSFDPISSYKSTSYLHNMIPRSNALNGKKTKFRNYYHNNNIIPRDSRLMGKKYKIRFGDSRNARAASPPRVITSLHALYSGGYLAILQYLRHLIIDRCTPQNDSRSIGTHDRNVYL